MKPCPRTLLTAAVLTTVSTGCAPGSRYGHVSVPFVWCGATLYQGVEALAPMRLHPVSDHRSDHAPPRSVLPPAAASRSPGERLEWVITGDCATAPVVTVSPVDAAWTLVVAHGANGGVAGLTLATFGRTITIRAYQGGRLVGELTLPHGAATFGPPATTSTVMPTDLHRHPRAAVIVLSHRSPASANGAPRRIPHVSVGAS